ncbi:unnamed protein product [Lactuca saligna]|uniref:Uncharacterized protein n=1 Tax=Lactuca saligna TaxID=75948 RepID=A0AA35Z7W3_LACSI|nr:unnamed protein product [Lactuca saligna]
MQRGATQELEMIRVAVEDFLPKTNLGRSLFVCAIWIERGRIRFLNFWNYGSSFLRHLFMLNIRMSSKLTSLSHVAPLSQPSLQALLQLVTGQHSLHLVIVVPQFEKDRFSFMHLTKWVWVCVQG